MTQPEEIGGKHGQEPQHNPAFLQKAFVGRLIEGELQHRCRMKPVLVLKKNLPRFEHARKTS